MTGCRSPLEYAKYNAKVAVNVRSSDSSHCKTTCEKSEGIGCRGIKISGRKDEVDVYICGERTFVVS